MPMAFRAGTIGEGGRGRRCGGPSQPCTAQGGPTETRLTDQSIQVSALCPHSPLGTETTMTRHPPDQEEPRAHPVVATHHTVGITAVSKVGELFLFSRYLFHFSGLKKLELSSEWLFLQFLLEHKPYIRIGSPYFILHPRPPCHPLLLSLLFQLPGCLSPGCLHKIGSVNWQRLEK